MREKDFHSIDSKMPIFDAFKEESNSMDKLALLFDLMNKQGVEKADAIVWLEGDATDRVKQCIRLMQSDYAPILLLSGGEKNPHDGSIPSWEIKQKFMDSGILEEKILIEDQSQHTKGQAINVLRFIKDRGWKKIILVSSPYHQIRAFLTFLAQLRKKGLSDSVHLINAPAHLEWFREIPAKKKSAIDLLVEEEIPRLKKYQVFGDVASFDEGIAYLQKKWHKGT